MRLRAIMALPRWQRNGGRDFAFYHSHSGFEWEDVDITNMYMDVLCQDFQVCFLTHICPHRYDSDNPHHPCVSDIQAASSPSYAGKALRAPLQVCIQLHNTSQWCLHIVTQRVIMFVWSIAKSGGAPSTLPGQPSSFLSESYDGIMHAVTLPEMLNPGCTYIP